VLLLRAFPLFPRLLFLIAWTLQPVERRPIGYWTADGNQNMRLLLEHVAAKKGFDPLNPNNWYNHNKCTLFSEPVLTLSFSKLRVPYPFIYKGGITVLKHYGGSFKRAVMDLFPNIGLQEHLFEHASSTSFEIYFYLKLIYYTEGYWTNNTKQFFYAYASTHAFDPNDERNWYNVTAKAIRKQLVVKNTGEKMEEEK
jgi:hypothetical protein